MIPSLDSAPTDAPPYRGRFNPDLAVVLTEVSTDGTNVHAEWSDPSEGEGIFFLQQTFPETGLRVDIPAGRTTWDVTEALPRGRNCFYVVVRLASGELGKSQPYCFQNRFGV